MRWLGANRVEPSSATQDEEWKSDEAGYRQCYYESLVILPTFESEFIGACEDPGHVNHPGVSLTFGR